MNYKYLNITRLKFFFIKHNRFLVLQLFTSIIFSITYNANSEFNSFNDTNSYFPLLQGSYWIWQDTVLRKRNSFEISEEIDPRSCYTIDSVISVKNTNSGKRIAVKRKIIAASEDTFTFFYNIDSNGTIWSSNSLKIAKSNLSLGDTLLNEIRTRYIIKNQKEDLAIAVSSLEKVFFRKRIGITNRLYSTKKGKNLIEYRIGNGPIIKKHWLMEALQNK